MKQIYLNVDDMRSYSLTPDVVWKTIKIEVPDDFVGGGKKYDLVTESWIDDVIPEITEEELKEQYIDQAESKKIHLLLLATDKIAPLQDAVDLGDALDEELVQLKAWKAFRRDVNRIDVSLAPDIDWPQQPAE